MSYFKFIVVVVAVAFAFTLYQRSGKTPSRAIASVASSYKFSTEVGEAAAQLRANRRADIYGGLDGNSQRLLGQLVREHCSRKFEEQSCLHYAISCGRPCLALLTKNERRRMLASYQKSSKVVGK